MDNDGGDAPQAVKCIGIFGKLFGHRFTQWGFKMSPATCFRCGYKP